MQVPHKRTRLIMGISYVIVMVFLVAMLLGQVLSVRYNVVYYYSELSALTTFQYSVNGQDRGTIELPATIDDLSSGDHIVLQGRIASRMKDNILINAEHTFLKFYVNESLYFELGAHGTYPEFQKEPPHTVTNIPLPYNTETLALRFEYTVPETGSSIDIPEFYIGDENLILSMLGDYNGALAGLSFLILMGGMFLIVLGFFGFRRVQAANVFIWLGLTCIASSIWTICSNELVIYMVAQPSLLYTLGYLGLFGILPAFFRFNQLIFDSGRNRLIDVIYYFAAAFFLLTIILHLSGIYSFFESIQALYFIGSALLLAYIISVVLERFYYKNPLTVRFIVSCGILAMFTILEVVNDVIGMVPTGLFFPLGLIFFVVELSAFAWRYVNNAVDVNERNAQLQLEIASVNRSLDAQRVHYETLTSSNEEVRKIRHDMRHQINVVRGYLENNRNNEAIEYLDEVYGAIPQTVELFVCDNFAINALATHYLAVAKEHDIQVDLRLVVPMKVGDTSDNDLSVIIGNLFENAIEACLHVEPHKRFIRMQSAIDERRFKLTIDNSYDGKLVVKNGDFFSRKRSGRGIGIASVRAIVQKYDGTMRYEAVDGVFKISLYIKI